MAQQPTAPATAAPQEPLAGRGRGGAPVQGAEEDTPLVERFDRNGDKRLNRDERTAAREHLAAHPELRRPAGRGRITRTGSPGVALAPKGVRSYGEKVPLYDRDALRTLFLEFEHADWEQELDAFYHTDVEVAGVSGRGRQDDTATSASASAVTTRSPPCRRAQAAAVAEDGFRARRSASAGHRSLQPAQLEPRPDVSSHAVLYLDIAREYIPRQRELRPRRDQRRELGHVRQPADVQQGVRAATRSRPARDALEVPEQLRTGGGLSYLGDDVALYRRWYEIKGQDDPWRGGPHPRRRRVLNETPPDQLEQALAPVMDVDAVLKYLALDITLVNNDGYWRDGSDFNLYLDEAGRFVLVPHDVNEGFRTGGPAAAARNRIRWRPWTIRTRPCATSCSPCRRFERVISPTSVTSPTSGSTGSDSAPIVERYQKLIADDVARDTRKLDATEAFTTGIYGPAEEPAPAATTIKGFADQRRAALLSHPEIVKARQR